MAQEEWMDLPRGLTLSFEDQPAAANCKAISDALVEFNRPHLRDPAFGRVGLLVRDEAGALMAGLVATFYAGWLFVDNLWVHAAFRRRGIGHQLLLAAERRALAAGCHSAWLDTWSFQAPDFYRRLGYEVFGTLDYPPDHQRLFLKKRLSPEVR
jgi:ribosomal protein S18 acetylase RimI-like enzyme